jgi:hypothetical protein
VRRHICCLTTIYIYRLGAVQRHFWDSPIVHALDVQLSILMEGLMEYFTVEQFIGDVINSVPKPYEADIIDRVFQAIEQNPEWLDRYNEMVKAHGKNEVDHSIGFNIVGLTGLRSLDRQQKAQSGLIETYTELGQGVE